MTTYIPPAEPGRTASRRSRPVRLVIGIPLALVGLPQPAEECVLLGGMPASLTAGSRHVSALPARVPGGVKSRLSPQRWRAFDFLVGGVCQAFWERTTSQQTEPNRTELNRWGM